MKQIFRHLVAALALTCGLVGQASAAKVLYFFDSFLAANNWSTAFTQRGDTVTTATSAGDLVAKLALGPWDVVVVAENDFDASSTYGTALISYITAGNRVVFNNWYSNAAFDTAFEAVVGTTNQSAISAANPLNTAFTLTNPGWGVFSQALTPTGSAVSACSFTAGGSCVVVGHSGRTVRLGMIIDTLPPAQAVPFLLAILNGIPASTPKTFAEAVGCAKAVVDGLSANQVGNLAQRSVLSQALGLALQYRVQYPSLSLAALSTVLPRIDGCGLRGTADTPQTAPNEISDWVTSCAAQAAMYACLSATPVK